jgi:GNAT superfamily N-acetyltransferase
MNVHSRLARRRSQLGFWLNNKLSTKIPNLEYNLHRRTSKSRCKMDRIQPLPNQIFLPPVPSLSQRWTALRLNVQAWYLYSSLTSSNPSTFRRGDIFCTTSQCTLPSEEAVEYDCVLESVINWYREQGVKGAIIWYLHPIPPVNLGARLYARGVCANWEPHWMWCDLREREEEEGRSDKFVIQISANDPNAAAEGEDTHLVWKIAALKGKKWVGGCLLNVTTGGHGVGGLFDRYVLEEERKQGLGTALAHASCELAGKLGCHNVVLNATEEGEPVYRRAGFQSMGKGYSWFLRGSILTQPPPTSKQVKFLEAVGMGDIKVLDTMRRDLTPEMLSEETINEETPLEIAVRCKQSASANWLIERGVVPDIMSLWDLGWKDRIPALLDAHPELVMRKAGRWSATPLHYAIERDDTEMAKLLLRVPHDLESKDGVFQSTPSEWAKRFRRMAIIELLELQSSDASV